MNMIISHLQNKTKQKKYNNYYKKVLLLLFIIILIIMEKLQINICFSNFHQVYQFEKN